jgi:hypothetical protein
MGKVKKPNSVRVDVSNPCEATAHGITAIEIIQERR